jgi:hypothetical protein
MNLKQKKTSLEAQIEFLEHISKKGCDDNLDCRPCPFFTLDKKHGCMVCGAGGSYPTTTHTYQCAKLRLEELKKLKHLEELK